MFDLSETNKYEYVFYEVNRIVSKYDRINHAASFSDIDKLFNYLFENFSVVGLTKEDFGKYVPLKNKGQFVYNFETFSNLPETCVMIYILRYMLAVVRIRMSCSGVASLNKILLSLPLDIIMS
jgi:hypothetical protein